MAADRNNSRKLSSLDWFTVAFCVGRSKDQTRDLSGTNSTLYRQSTAPTNARMAECTKQDMQNWSFNTGDKIAIKFEKFVIIL